MEYGEPCWVRCRVSLPRGGIPDAVRVKLRECQTRIWGEYGLIRSDTNYLLARREDLEWSPGTMQLPVLPDESRGFRLGCSLFGHWFGIIWHPLHIAPEWAYLKAIWIDESHDRGEGSPYAKIRFCSPPGYGPRQMEVWVPSSDIRALDYQSIAAQEER